MQLSQTSSASSSSCLGILLAHGLLLANFFLTAADAAALDLFDAQGAQDANELAKRAGFVGMRGKKEDETFGNNYENYLPDENDEFEKRGSMGFTGMRGKKDLFGLNALSGAQWQALEQLAAQAEAEGAYPTELRRSEEVGAKRGSSAFVGMRGKKSGVFEGDALAQELQRLYAARGLGKRAGFVGMRGKKRQANWQNRLSPKFRRGGQSGFVGMRG